jgi:hydroxyacylglutathione hydrolase
VQPIKVIIIGGGFSGAMTAYHLLRQDKVACAITIVEPKKPGLSLGLGLAYSTTCDEHLLNVSAAGMSALADQPDDFLNYARTKDPAVKATDFLPRKFFGQYVQELLNSAIAEAKVDFHSFSLVQQSALDIEEVDEDVDEELEEDETSKQRLKVKLDNEQFLAADIVVLALGNLSGKQPAWIDKLPMTSAHYIHNPWNTEAIETIDSNDSVLLVGTGLTAVDKIIELKARGHVGTITAASRHGLLPRRHLDLPELQPPQLNWEEIDDIKLSALSALKFVRQQSAQAVNWQAGVDSFRSITQRWWSNLALDEKRNFMRHLQTYWDIHRHRMAPSIAAKIESYQKSGQLRVLSGGIKQMQQSKTEVAITIKERYSKAETILFDRVINCTGPQLKLKAIDSQLMANLHKRGLIAPDPTGAGINCLPSGELIDRSGKVNNRIFAIGPLLKAVLLESVAVPELKGQTQALAQLICSQQTIQK